MEVAAFYFKMRMPHFLVIFLLMTSFTSYTQEFPEMVEVKGGSFIMGDDSGDEDERPAHEVHVSTFWIARTETTVKQWKAFCTATKRAMPEAPWFGLKDDHPIVNISWDDAIAYCKWLSVIDKKSYRLPTEAEWEFAARGGVKGKGYAYSGAKVPDSISWFSSRSNGTMPVALKLPNELGLYDMTGNVWEWCSDWYDVGYYMLKVKDNPTGPSRALGSKFYTLRGGAWDIGARNSRNTYRNPLSPTSRNHNKGFRVASSN
jgi:formylglycine-generating enzyme required for sulfatase activity